MARVEKVKIFNTRTGYVIGLEFDDGSQKMAGIPIAVINEKTHGMGLAFQDLNEAKEWVAEYEKTGLNKEGKFFDGSEAIDWSSKELKEAKEIR